MFRRSHLVFERRLNGLCPPLIRHGFPQGLLAQSRSQSRDVNESANDPTTFDFAKPEHYKTSADVPFTKTIQVGKQLLHNATHNKGLAFTYQERRHYHLHGLLPPVYLDLDTQAKQIMANINRMKDPLDQNMFLMNILDTSSKLFYRTLCENLPTLMPIGKCFHYDILFAFNFKTFSPYLTVLVVCLSVHTHCRFGL